MEKITTEIIHKEIDLIQSSITRMAHNSFLIKGWTISLIAVVLALSDKNINPLLLTSILVIPLISFWYLDAFFLHTEKMYRQMYETVIKKRKDGSDEQLYDLNPTQYIDQVDSRIKLMFSTTLRFFYGIPLLIILGILAFNIYTGYCKEHPESKSVKQTNSIIIKDTKDTSSGFENPTK